VNASRAQSPDTPPPSEAGAVQVEGELATLVFRRLLRHSPQVVWEAITDPQQIRVWFMTEAMIDGRKGGSVDFVTGPYRVHSTGQILEWDPPRLYEHEWVTAPTRYLPKGESSVVRWELTPTDGGTLLVLTHRKLSKATAIVFSGGLRVFLDRLAAHLDGVALPDWQDRIREANGSPGSVTNPHSKTP
jgi:uncharacterized protein YndB with AHSA1/START domain